MEVTDFAKLYQTDSDSKTIIDTAFGLEGLVRQTGMHAAGIVISKGPLVDYLPIMRKGEDNPVITQWDMGRVEQCGLLKIDFLGLRNLGVIDKCVKLVKKHRGIDLDIDKIPLDDKSTYAELCKGNAIGVFQLESSGMRELMVQLQPQNIEDIMVLYQEDVLGVSRELAGFSSAEADDLRKVIGKKLMDKIALFRQKFVDGCVATSGLSKDKANKIYSDIEYFGGYGFNRAHAASYAMISYITAYLKTNYRSEYMAALLTSVAGNKDKLSLYLSDCRKVGIEVLPPSINSSQEDFTVLNDSQIVFGLSAINGIGYAVSEAILSNRNESKPYTSMHDFLRRTNVAVLKKSTMEHLAASGAFDELITDVEEELSLVFWKKRKKNLVFTYLKIQ